MKKLLLLFAFIGIGLTTINAQDISFGVKAGPNIANLTGYDVYSVSGRISYHLGAVVNVEFSDIIALQPELVYSSQGYKAEDSGIDVKGVLDYVNIPIMVDFTLTEGFSLQGGPQVGINVSAKEKEDGESVDIENVETLDLAVAGGIQYKLPVGLFFQARYTAGILKVVKDVDVKNSVISASVGWFFN
ncbi:MAG: PorT family protein [Altibacter sp.]|nr:PorT family protein [Altibacter sp.]